MLRLAARIQGLPNTSTDTPPLLVVQSGLVWAVAVCWVVVVVVMVRQMQAVMSLGMGVVVRRVVS